MRRWDELQSGDDAIALIRKWADRAPHARVIAASVDSGRRTLEWLQVSTRSGLGAVAFHTGGLLVDYGWLRVLGSGSNEVPRTLDGWNLMNGKPRCEEGLLVADDVLGGFFAWFSEVRTIHYLAPDTLAWEDLGCGYTDWLEWCLSDGPGDFYADYRWSDWRDELARLPGDSAWTVYPPLWTEGPAFVQRMRAPVPVSEAWDVLHSVRSQLAIKP